MASRSWIEVPIEQEVWGVPDDGYAPFVFPPEGASLLFHFTEESFLRVLSALINGAALTYPDTWLQVVWDFLGNVEYPVSLCDQIAECIANNAATQAALRNFVTGDTVINQHIEGIATAGTPMTTPQIEAPIGDSCDENAAFGGWTALIRQMDTNNRDLFERIEVGTNALERSNIVISAIPGIGLFPADEIFQFLDTLINDLAENYVAQYTTTLEDTLRCGLFCLALDSDCGLNFEQVFGYFNNRLGSSFTVESLFLDILSFIGGGAWSGTEIVDAMMLFQVAVLRHASKFIDFAVHSLQTSYQLGLNDPDPDWATLCDCAPEVPKVVMFSAAGQASGSFEQIGPNTYRFTSAFSASNHRISFYYDNPERSVRVTAISYSTIPGGPNWEYQPGAHPEVNYTIDYTVGLPNVGDCIAGLYLRRSGSGSAFTVDITFAETC